jgi:hypothetical protein
VLNRRIERVKRRAGALDAKLRLLGTRTDLRLEREDGQTAALRKRVEKLEANKAPNQTRTLLLGLISGFVIAVLGHLVKWAIDAGRERSDRRRRERALLAACGAELTHAHATAERNRETVERDLAQLRANREVLKPVTRLDLLTVARMIETPPRNLTRDGDLLQAITVLRVNAEYANDLAKTREVYKGLASSDVPGLIVVDELLESQFKQLVADIAVVTPKLSALA